MIKHHQLNQKYPLIAVRWLNLVPKVSNIIYFSFYKFTIDKTKQNKKKCLICFTFVTFCFVKRCIVYSISHFIQLYSQFSVSISIHIKLIFACVVLLEKAFQLSNHICTSFNVHKFCPWWIFHHCSHHITHILFLIFTRSLFFLLTINRQFSCREKISKIGKKPCTLYTSKLDIRNINWLYHLLVENS